MEQSVNHLLSKNCLTILLLLDLNWIVLTEYIGFAFQELLDDIASVRFGLAYRIQRIHFI